MKKIGRRDFIGRSVKSILACSSGGLLSKPPMVFAGTGRESVSGYQVFPLVCSNRGRNYHAEVILQALVADAQLVALPAFSKLRGEDHHWNRFRVSFYRIDGSEVWTSQRALGTFGSDQIEIPDGLGWGAVGITCSGIGNFGTKVPYLSTTAFLHTTTPSGSDTHHSLTPYLRQSVAFQTVFVLSRDYSSLVAVFNPWNFEIRATVSIHEGSGNILFEGEYLWKQHQQHYFSIGEIDWAPDRVCAIRKFGVPQGLLVRVTPKGVGNLAIGTWTLSRQTSSLGKCFIQSHGVPMDPAKTNRDSKKSAHEFRVPSCDKKEWFKTINIGRWYQAELACMGSHPFCSQSSWRSLLMVPNLNPFEISFLPIVVSAANGDPYGPELKTMKNWKESPPSVYRVPPYGVATFNLSGLKSWVNHDGGSADFGPLYLNSGCGKGISHQSAIKLVYLRGNHLTALTHMRPRVAVSGLSSRSLTTTDGWLPFCMKSTFTSNKRPNPSSDPVEGGLLLHSAEVNRLGTKNEIVLQQYSRNSLLKQTVLNAVPAGALITWPLQQLEWGKNPSLTVRVLSQSIVTMSAMGKSADQSWSIVHGGPRFRL